MKKMTAPIWKTNLAIGGLCACTLLTNAAPLRRADVAANPAWLVHVDCDGLRATTLGKYILEQTDKPEAKAKLEAFQSMFQFNLRTQLHGATLYGNSLAPGDGLLMIYADFDTMHLISLAEAAKDSQSNPHGDNMIYSWIDENKKATNGVKPRTYAAIAGNRVLFSQSEECVGRALDVLAGTAPNLTSSKVFPELGEAGDAHFAEAAARKLVLPEGNPSAAILKLSQSMQFVMGESRQQFTAALTLVADNAEVSGHILSIAQGLLALAKLQTDKPESIKIANAITLTQSGERVLGNLQLPAAEVVEVIKADAARKAAKAANAPQN